MPTTLIINADDFGYLPGVTDAIIDAHRRGILTSTTLMCTMPDAARAIAEAARTPTLGVGIHLCLTQGRPLAPGHRHITRHPRSAQGERTKSSEAILDQSVRELLLKVQFSRAARLEAHAEWHAQIDFAISRGLRPTHLDSHKHIHHWPVLAKIAIELAKEYGIPAIRSAREVRIGRGPRGTGYRVVGHLANRLAKQIHAAGLQTSDWFYGLAATGRFDSAHWEGIVKHLPEGIGEIMVHPGAADGLAATGTRLIAAREAEWKGLIEPRIAEALRERNVRLGSWAIFAPK